MNVQMLDRVCNLEMMYFGLKAEGTARLASACHACPCVLAAEVYRILDKLHD